MPVPSSPTIASIVTEALKLATLGAKNAAGALTITCSNGADDDKVIAFWRPA